MPALTVISSMATRQILQDLAQRFQAETGQVVGVESIGGVDAARRVRAGEAFDVVVLADDALRALAAEGHVQSETVTAFAASPAALAVRAGTLKPAGLDEANVKAFCKNAATIALSTGPSGTSMAKRLASWAIGADRIVIAPPGVPVARLLADGRADVGVQQLSELLGQPGIDIVGALPETVQPLTMFTCGVGARSTNSADARALLAALTAPAAAAVKQRHGMQ